MAASKLDKSIGVWGLSFNLINLMIGAITADAALSAVYYLLIVRIKAKKENVNN